MPLNQLPDNGKHSFIKTGFFLDEHDVFKVGYRRRQ